MYKIVSFDLQSYRYLCADRKHDAGYVLSGLTPLILFLHKNSGYFASKEGITGKSSVVHDDSAPYYDLFILFTDRQST